MKARIQNGDEILSEFELAEGEYLLGSSPSALLRLESELVAPEHARLFIKQGIASIEDISGGRGVFIAGFPLRRPRTLPDHAAVNIGEFTIRIWNEAVAGPVVPEVESGGRHQIGELVAQGAMGVIKRAWEVATGREVAMKQMHPELESGNPALGTRFLEEAKITALLEHPNIVPVHEVGPAHSGARFYTMKMVRGISLQKVFQLLDQRVGAVVEKYSLDQLLLAFQKSCDAVAFAHSKGVIHRDLKPANIMIGEFGEVLVMDWGLAKLVGDAAEKFAADHPEAFIRAGAGLTLAGTVAGTPLYMPPEQASGDVAAIDERSDVYALGAILYELLTLKTPVAGRNVAEVLHKVSQGKIDPPENRLGPKPPAHLVQGRVPASLSAVVMKALALSPERRYQRVTDLQADLRAFQNGFPTSAEGAGAGRQFLMLVRRNRGVARALATSAALLALLSTAYTIWVDLEGRRAIQERDRATQARVVTETEKERADGALKRLEKAAPTFAVKSDSAVKEGNIEEALKLIGFSIDMDQQNASYRVSRGDIYQANERFPEAIADYERAMKIKADQRTSNNLALARRLQQENGGAPQLRPDLRRQLFAALTTQGRIAQVKPPTPPARYSPEEKALFLRLGGYTFQPGWNDGRISRAADGGLRLDLYGLSFSSLTHLRGTKITELYLGASDLADLKLIAGFPLKILHIGGTRVTDISPLFGMQLIQLDLGGLAIPDLRPLRGMPLRVLNLWNCRVADLSPLAGAPLENLDIDYSPTASIAPLRGMPLRRLRLFATGNLKDFTPLATLRELDNILLPTHSAQLGFLKAATKLRLVHHPRFAPGDLPAAEFFKLSDASDAAWAKWSPTIAKTGATDLLPYRLTVDARGIIELNLRDIQIQNLAPLAVLPPTRLLLNTATKLDLNPLQRSAVIDLDIVDANVPAILPVFTCPKLESVTISRNATDVHLLRNHPTLRFLSYQSDTVLRRPRTTVADFFAPGPRMAAEGCFLPGNAVAAANFDNPEAFAAGWRGQNLRGENTTIVWTSDPNVEGGRGGGYLSLLETRSDNSPASLVASAAFLGNQQAAYGGTLKFRVRHLHAQSDGGPDVELRSGTTRLSYTQPKRASQRWQTFTTPFHESANWKTNRPGQPLATKEELQAVLGKLEQISIRAEFAREPREKTDLDEITLTTPAQDAKEAERLAALKAKVQTMIAPWEADQSAEALAIYRELFTQTGDEEILAAAHAIFARGRWKTAWFKSSADPVAQLEAWRSIAKSAAATEVEVPAIAFRFDNSSPGRLGISPALAQNDPGPNFFGMIAKTRLKLPAGTWRFSARSDDGCRVLVNGRMLMESWRGQRPETITGLHTQAQEGEVEVVLEYFQNDVTAQVSLSLAPILEKPAATPPK